jgi:hypothetical protein
MTANNSVPRRHWRSYGDDPLPSPREALREPFSAFPSWFLRIAYGFRSIVAYNTELGKTGMFE